MFDASHYVPILLAKRGERIALRELPTTIRSGFTPLLEVPQVPMDWEEDEPKPLDTYIKAFPKRLNTDWGSSARFFLDVPYLLRSRGIDRRATSGLSPLRGLSGI